MLRVITKSQKCTLVEYPHLEGDSAATRAGGEKADFSVTIHIFFELSEC